MRAPILPNLPALNDKSRLLLVDKCNTISLDNILHYVETGEINIETEMPKLRPDRKEWLLNEYQKWLDEPEPADPQEVIDWEDVSSIDVNDASQWNILKVKINQYKTKYSDSKPLGNHLNEVLLIANDIKKQEDSIKKQKEREEYEKVDKSDYKVMLQYLRKHPDTIHLADLDDALWKIASMGKDIRKLHKFMEDLPNSHHMFEANAILNEYVTWNEVKRSRDIYKVHDYIVDNHESPFMNEAKLLESELVDDELKEMRKNITSYDIIKFRNLINAGIFTIDELVDEDIVTDNSIETLNNLDDLREQLPAIDQTKVQNECPAGYTDVYFFGIPSTGKTCILMGLLGSSKFDWNAKVFGGSYANDLCEYLNAGLTPDSTSGNFVTLVNGSVSDDEKTEVAHPVNIIEMSGEEFAFRIADNPDAILSFEDMGTGATELLKNNNRKVFFIIVDPTTEIVKINRMVEVEDNEGNIKKVIQTRRVSQKSILKGLVSLFDLKQNTEVMKKVDAIHIVVTKADMLDNTGNRSIAAKERVVGSHSDVLRTLKRLCKESNYAINVTTGYLPKLYTFSLGRFYMGGIYEYDPTDADKLIGVIGNVTRGKRDVTFLDKVKDSLNKAIF